MNKGEEERTARGGHEGVEEPGPQFAPPPQGARFDKERSDRGARIPCTRDGNHDETDPAAAAVWALALGLAIGRHGAHWARSFARAVVRLHIVEGRLEVFFHQQDEPVRGDLAVDDVFAAFTEAWSTIAIEGDETRWRDERAITLYEWDVAVLDEETGHWYVARDGMDTENTRAMSARREAVEHARATIGTQLEAHERPVDANELLETTADVAASAFVEAYMRHANVDMPLTVGSIGTSAIATLPEPWRREMLEAIAGAQRAVLERHEERWLTPEAAGRGGEEPLQ